jgi:hypothetical protein
MLRVLKPKVPACLRGTPPIHKGGKFTTPVVKTLFRGLNLRDRKTSK